MTTPDPIVSGAVRKAALRVLPLLGALATMNFLDRANVGFAALRMNADIGLSATAFGLGAGLFFLGYFFFEVPSNLLLHRVGARRWIARIALTWGIAASAQAFVDSPTAFFIVRFLLGVAEAGFFPGMVLYLTYWFPRRHRAHMMSLLLLALPMASVIGAPVSTLIMEHGAGLLGFDAGWRTMFFLEGLPSILLAVACWAFLPDRPQETKWLTSQERQALADTIEAEDRVRVPDPPGLRRSLRDARVLVLCAVYFGVVYGLYALTFFLPQVIAGFESGFGVRLDLVEVGLVSAIPFACGAAGMLWNARHSDRKEERVFHLAAPSFIGAVGVACSLYLQSPYLAVIALSVCTAGVLAALPVFWQVPAGFLGGVGAAGGIALINSCGNLSGFAAPFVTGWLKDATGDFRAGMWAVAAFMTLAAVLTVAFRRRLVEHGDGLEDKP
ncbi:MFS transporter [Streptomyces sp. NBC_01264]|uniref:MFS transporter n=1 Tax=Streptomyces sp. NBC_01264 TaxID=2903804 RepID=UPI002251A9F1|nr:MFS transporter [Streptomyces sp. NBC_01264]MCX4775319.1 MFS transporter [Streptomyces sp. NBC_01264]